MTARTPGPEAKKGLVDALRSLLGGEESSSAPNSGLARFESTVEKLVQAHGKAILGRLHYLNLEELIIRRGPGGKTRLKKAENVFFAVIGRNLKEGETYVRPDISTVYFLFPTLSREAGALKCAAIADQITRGLREADPIFAEIKSEHSVQSLTAKTWNASHAARRAAAALGGEAHAAQRPGGSGPRRSGASVSGDILPAPPAAADHRLDGIQVFYRGIWNVRSRMITSYAAVPCRRLANGTVIKGRGMLGADAGFALIAALDSLVLRKSSGWLHGLINVRQQALLILPVHFTTIDNQSLFMTLRRDLAALSEDERKYVVVEIFGAPDSLSSFRIKEVVSRIRPLVRCVLAHLPRGSDHLHQWVEGGILGVGFAAGEEKAPEKTVMEKMNAFVAAAEKAGVHAYVHDLTTPSLATGAITAGFRYLGGEAVMAESEVPNPIESFECQNIFARLLGA